jgi:hypothetical protein
MFYASSLCRTRTPNLSIPIFQNQFRAPNGSLLLLYQRQLRAQHRSLLLSQNQIRAPNRSLLLLSQHQLRTSNGSLLLLS